MYNLNRVTLIGTIGELELRCTPTGKKVISFTIATQQEPQQLSEYAQVVSQDYHKLVAWGKLAESISVRCRAGEKVFVEGRLKTSEFNNRHGSPDSRTEIIVEDFYTVS